MIDELDDEPEGVPCRFNASHECFARDFDSCGCCLACSREMDEREAWREEDEYE